MCFRIIDGPVTVVVLRNTRLRLDLRPLYGFPTSLYLGQIFVGQQCVPVWGHGLM